MSFENGPKKILKLANLSIFYRNKSLLRNISFSIEQNSLTSIWGPSGVGKTTLLRSMNRLLEEEYGFKCHGKIFFHNQDIFRKRYNVYALRRSIGIVFQKPVIFPISISKNVVFGVHHLNLAKKKQYDAIVETHLKEVSLWDEVKDRLDDSALELSLGQQQRLAIARTLAVDPEIILMDEPSSSLDQQATNKIEELILKLKKNRTIVLVTHQWKQAKHLSDQIIELQANHQLGASCTKVFKPGQQPSASMSH